jgi:transposase
MRRRHELTDAQWEAIGPHLPGKKGDPGRTAEDNRKFVNAVRWLVKTGAPGGDSRNGSVTGTVCLAGSAVGLPTASGRKSWKLWEVIKNWKNSCSTPLTRPHGPPDRAAHPAASR